MTQGTKSGGASYQGFINNMEKDAFANASDAERLAIEAAGLRKPFKPKELPKPIGPGKEWTTADLVTASLFVALRQNIIQLPLPTPPPG